MNSELEIIADDKNPCGEAPLWDDKRNRLLWTDCAGLVYQYDPATGNKQILNRDLVVNGMALNSDGALVFAGPKGLFLSHGQDHYRQLVANHDGEALCFNDLIADAQGRVYAGSYYWGANGREKTGRLYLIESKGAVRVLDDGIDLANGFGFSPDDHTLYFADSAARKIYQYDVDPGNGALRNKRVFVSVPGTEGLPDGLTVDSEGFVWSAQWYGAQVVRYDPAGKVERRISMPATQISSVAFGGPDLNELYITSAAESWPSQCAPPGYDFTTPNLGGSLYRLRLDVHGRPEHRAAFK